MNSTRRFLAVMAACCIGPMAAMVVLTSALGVAMGWASAMTLGLVAAGACVALMVQRHRDHADQPRP